MYNYLFLLNITQGKFIVTLFHSLNNCTSNTKLGTLSLESYI